MLYRPTASVGPRPASGLGASFLMPALALRCVGPGAPASAELSVGARCLSVLLTRAARSPHGSLEIAARKAAAAAARNDPLDYSLAQVSACSASGAPCACVSRASASVPRSPRPRVAGGKIPATGKDRRQSRRHRCHIRSADGLPQCRKAGGWWRVCACLRECAVHTPSGKSEREKIKCMGDEIEK